MNGPQAGRPRIALVLPGGGARSAYQVGVLQAIASWYPPRSRLPFPILCGTSAGAINAAVLATHPRCMAPATDALGPGLGWLPCRPGVSRRQASTCSIPAFVSSSRS
jgi:hypothetical protein